MISIMTLCKRGIWCNNKVSTSNKNEYPVRLISVPGIFFEKIFQLAVTMSRDPAYIVMSWSGPIVNWLYQERRMSQTTTQNEKKEEDLRNVLSVWAKENRIESTQNQQINHVSDIVASIFSPGKHYYFILYFFPTNN